jgi:SAM-dependent methyltransferase
MTPADESHYGAAYFAWQTDIGQFGGWANQFMFAPYLKATDRVLDFGCGGGYLLAQLDVAETMGVEINPVARDSARGLGIDVRPSTADVPDGWADVIISNHALEHCRNPHGEIEALRSKLRPGGRFVCVVPDETARQAYDPDDHNRHLYTWSPMNLGHLFGEAGYDVLSSEELVHRWPPFSRQIAKVGGAPLFHLASRLYGRLRRTVSQVRVVARRPADG